MKNVKQTNQIRTQMKAEEEREVKIKNALTHTTQHIAQSVAKPKTKIKRKRSTETQVN